jgi:Taurine catabolism dioxygenase TauD, TfdA family
VSPLTNALGAEARGIDLREKLDPATVAELTETWHRYKVLFFPEQPVDRAQHKRFARYFGEMWQHPFLKDVHDDGDFVELYSGGDTGRSFLAENWHTDVTFAECPRMGSVLHALVVPEYGGDTMWLVSEVAIIRGGARIGFPSGDEFSAMGFTNYVPISEVDYTAIDLAPRDGLLFQERAFDGGPGRFYYSGGGAVYQVRDVATLRAVGVDADSPVEIPAHGLDGAPRIPETGTLRRPRGGETTWIIDGGARSEVTDACADARVVVLPGDSQVLDEIPIGPAS